MILKTKHVFYQCEIFYGFMKIDVENLTGKNISHTAILYK